MRDSRSNADSRHTHVAMVACTPVNPASSAGRGASCSTSAPRAFLGLAGRRRAPQAATGSHAYRARLSAQASAAQSEAAPPAGEAKPDPFATKEVYSDNWFDRLMIWWAASRRIAPSRAALHTWGGWERPPGDPAVDRGPPLRPRRHLTRTLCSASTSQPSTGISPRSCPRSSEVRAGSQPLAPPCTLPLLPWPATTTLAGPPPCPTKTTS